MSRVARRIVGTLWWSVALFHCVACQGHGISANDSEFNPVNEQEALEYKKALIRCYKTGGSRIVKIMGDLRCY